MKQEVRMDLFFTKPLIYLNNPSEIVKNKKGNHLNMEKQEGTNFDFDKYIGPIRKPSYNWSSLSKEKEIEILEKGKEIVQKFNELENSTK